MYKLGFALFLIGFFLAFLGIVPKEIMNLMSDPLKLAILISVSVGITFMIFGSFQD